MGTKYSSLCTSRASDLHVKELSRVASKRPSLLKALQTWLMSVCSPTEMLMRPKLETATPPAANTDLLSAPGTWSKPAARTKSQPALLNSTSLNASRRKTTLARTMLASLLSALRVLELLALKLLLSRPADPALRVSHLCIKLLSLLKALTPLTNMSLG